MASPSSSRLVGESCSPDSTQMRNIAGSWTWATHRQMTRLMLGQNPGPSEHPPTSPSSHPLADFPFLWFSCQISSSDAKTKDGQQTGTSLLILPVLFVLTQSMFLFRNRRYSFSRLVGPKSMARSFLCSSLTIPHRFSIAFTTSSGTSQLETSAEVKKSCKPSVVQEITASPSPSRPVCVLPLAVVSVYVSIIRSAVLTLIRSIWRDRTSVVPRS